MIESIGDSKPASPAPSERVARVIREVLPPIRASQDEVLVSAGSAGLGSLVWHSRDGEIPGVEVRADGAVTSVNGIATEPFYGNETGQSWD